jgi:MFS family permease
MFAMAFTSAFALAPTAGGYVLAHAGARWVWIDCLVIGSLVAVGFFVLSVVLPHRSFLLAQLLSRNHDSSRAGR